MPNGISRKRGKQTRVRRQSAGIEKAALVPTGDSTYEGQAFDTLLHAWLGKFTAWLSPPSLGIAVFDWLSHLAMLPAKQSELFFQVERNLFQFVLFSPFFNDKENLSNEPRFANKAWQEFPFNLLVHYFLMGQRWWRDATVNIRGMSKHHEHVVHFMTRQVFDMFSPSNFIWTNPEILDITFRQGGGNLIRGFLNLTEDLYRFASNAAPAGAENFKVGVNVAVTPGKVIYRNHLMELLQYTPTTERVYTEPILVIPAWIMKYYILDLSAHNSLVKYLVDNGHTVFMISWKNPKGGDCNIGFEDYLHSGIMDALHIIQQIVPNQKVHAAGYCLGGTLLAIAAAAMANQVDNCLKSITLFAAQVDFRDPGELSLFIDQSQITYLEDIMWEKGYLDGSQMAGTFSMLRSNDRIWSRMIQDYLFGQRRPFTDLMAWNQDATRLPFKMHSEYLNSLFLNNDLVYGRFTVGRKRIALVNIKIPIFAVGTVRDHVSPWRSVYKIHLFANTQVTFVLTSGGHNAGIVSEPGHKGRFYQMEARKKGARHVSSNTWLEWAPRYEGSWWPAWQNWLSSLCGEKTSPPPFGNSKKDLNALCDAPGVYVLQK